MGSFTGSADLADGGAADGRSRAALFEAARGRCGAESRAL